ncbi:MAG: FAD-dependent oxidoreductase [Caldimonas sp.]
MNKRWWIAAVVVLMVAAWFALGLGHYLNLDVLKSEQARLEAWRAGNPLRAAVVFFAIYVAVTGLSLPGATILTLAAGAIFGLAWGTLIASFAASIGATIAFLLSRWVLRDWVASHFAARLRSVDDGIRKGSSFYLLTLRLVPALPFFLINLAMGLTAIGTLTFYWVSQLGMLVGTVVYVNAGTQLARVRTLSDIASPGLLLSFVLLALVPLATKAAVDGYRRRKLTARWHKPSHFDRNLVVIGAGSAGLVSAYIAAAVKAKVTLVERDRMGGDCLNTGCVPSKALIRTARLVADIGRAAELGLRGARADVDFAATMERVQRVVGEVAPHDSVERYTALGVEVLAGDARIATPWQVDITRADGTVQSLSTRSIVIATGAAPAIPDIPGLAESGYVTSDTIWSLRTLPARLLVLGGGPIGCELAQAFARLGSRVTQVEMGPRLLSREDDDVAALVTAQFLAEGVDLRVDHCALRFERQAEERVLVSKHSGNEVRIPFDVVLIAVGRAARLKGFGLDELGIDTGKTVETNGFLQTTLPNIYAAGDVAGPYQFTHVAAHQAWYATVNALFDPFKKFRVDDRVIPAATFVEPEVARVGLNVREATEQKLAHEVTIFHVADLDRAIADSAAKGFVKVLTVLGKDRILGVTIVGEHAADILAEFVLAMKHGIGLNKILGTIHTYPTMSEANKSVAGAWRLVHQPTRLLAFAARFHAWRRG